MTRALKHKLIQKITIKLLKVMLFSLFSVSVWAQPNLSFEDVPQDHWAAGSVERLRGVGMLEGFPDGAYYGNLALSRYQMAVLLDRMLILAKQEAQSEGLSISEISALQQQIDQLNAILSQSVESLIAPNSNTNSRTTLTVPNSVSTGANQQSQQGMTSRSGLITPASPQSQQSNFYQVQQNQTESFSTFDNTSQANQSINTPNQSTVSGTAQTSASGSQDAQQIIATYQVSPSAIEYQQYLDAYMAVYGSSESGADNVQQINTVGVVPGDAGAVSNVAAQLQNQQLQVQQAQSQQAQSQQYAEQFAQQYQLQAQQPLGFAGDFAATQPLVEQQAFVNQQAATNQQAALQDSFQYNLQGNTEDTRVITSNGVYLQLGAFANALSAESLSSELSDLGFSAMQQEQTGLYKVLVGPFDFVSVQSASEALTAQGYSFFMVR